MTSKEFLIMKRYVLRQTLIAIPLLVMTSLITVGCTIYKPNPDLNVYHPMIYETYGDKLNKIKGVLCTKQEFVDNFGPDLSLKPKLSIVLEKGYSRYITGNIYYNNKQTAQILNKQVRLSNSLYQKECGINRRYPVLHEFDLDIVKDYPDRKGKEIRMKEYYDIVNQIKQNKYLDVRAIVVPMVNTSIEGSAQDARMYFTDEQVRELFRNKEQLGLDSLSTLFEKPY